MITHYLLAILIGLIFGSFANVLLYRLPIMLERDWELAQEPSAEQAAQAESFNLALPASHCPACQHRLAWYENIPVISYVFLRGKCAHCHAPISWHYPAVELACAVIFALCTWRYGFGVAALAWSIFVSACLVLFILDFKHYFLPDAITLPLIWLGLLFASFGLNSLTSLTSAVWGAILGYMILWLVYWIFKLVTGKEGMGFGDFKLLAAVGAWFGWQAIVPVLLLSSLTGAVLGTIMLRVWKSRERKASEDDIPPNAIAFGPYIILAALLLWCFPELQALLWAV